MSDHPWSGRTLGNYVIGPLLGHGGMGLVFAAEHRFLGDRVAVKILRGIHAGNRKISRLFRQEALATREIGHSGIVRIIDFGQTEMGEFYLVMEQLHGRSLADVLARIRLDEPTAARIGSQAAIALAAAHAKGIIHRDLKPANIFLVPLPDGNPPDEKVPYQVKVLDFGIAKMLSESGPTSSDGVMGTARYMAPEQARGGKAATPQADVYSLGVILFQMLTGRTPFEGDGVQIITQAILDAPPSPAAFAAVSPEMNRLVLQCLAKDPEARPSSMDALGEQLASLGGAGPIELPALLFATDALHVPSMAEQLGLANTATLSTAARRPSPIPEARSRLRARRAALLLGAAASLGILVSAASRWSRLTSYFHEGKTNGAPSAPAPKPVASPQTVPGPPPSVATTIAPLSINPPLKAPDTARLKDREKAPPKGKRTHVAEGRMARPEIGTPHPLSPSAPPAPVPPLKPVAAPPPSETTTSRHGADGENK